jgi:hypothetical protein
MKLSVDPILTEYQLRDIMSFIKFAMLNHSVTPWNNQSSILEKQIWNVKKMKQRFRRNLLDSGKSQNLIKVRIELILR